MNNIPSAETEIRAVLKAWAQATRRDRKDDILRNHAGDVVIYDVLPPMKYDSAEAYRRSWDEWQPDTQGEAIFDLEDLVVTAGNDVAFAYGFIRCAGTLVDGQAFEDLVRATFCLKKTNGAWMVQHQHVSSPLQISGD